MSNVTFNYNLPEDDVDYQMHINAKNYYLALWDLSQQIRQWYKYEDKESIEIEKLSNKFWEILEDNKADLDY